MASFPRAKVDSSTQTDPILPFTALLEKALDSVEATVPLNLASITFYIRRHHLSRIEQIESLLSQNFFFKFVLFRIGLKPQHVFSFLCVLTLYGCRQLYRRSVYLTTNICAVAYPAYCSIRTINSEPIAPPPELGLEPTEFSPVYGSRRNSIYSSGSLRLNRRRSRRSLNRMNEDSALSSNNSYSSSQEDYESRRSMDSSWDRPSDYSIYSEDNITTTSGGSGAMTVEEKLKQRMRRRWNKFSQTRKDKATRQWLAYWSIYGTVQVVDTWSAFLLDWIPGYNLGKLMFLWWAQRRGATLIFDYFQPLIQAKSRDGREVARKPSNRSLNSEISRHGRGGSSGGAGGSGSRPVSIQVLPSALAQQQQQFHQQFQQQQPQYQQQQFEQQFNAKGVSRRDTAAFRELNQGRYMNQAYEDGEEDEDDDHDEYELHHHRQQHLQQQQLKERPMDLHRELMASSPHDSGAFAETSLFESAESVWSAATSAPGVQVVDDTGLRQAAFGSLARLHSNNATPTPMSIQEQYHAQQQRQQAALQNKAASSPEALHSYAVASTSHWSPSLSSSAPAEDH
ncbi:hypothetical protein BGZ67_010775 [Mortierella alpina]|nr:hypothetical protein BGZ67_010775 [Mortierella alpina]